MKNSKRLIGLVILLLWALRSTEAQTDLIVQEGVIASCSLSGHVNIGLEKVVGDGVKVELCSPDWKNVLVSTKTDSNGYFSLKKTQGNLFYLRFSSPGVNTFQLKVRIRKHATHNLIIHLNIAT
jgi:hypothetical protein